MNEILSNLPQINPPSHLIPETDFFWKPSGSESMEKKLIYSLHTSSATSVSSVLPTLSDSKDFVDFVAQKVKFI